MNRVIDSEIERQAWNRRYKEKTLNPSYTFNKSLLRKLNKKENLDGLTASYNFEGKKILDIGTGDGAYILSLAQRFAVEKIVAVDFSEEAIRVARKKQERLGLKNCIFIVAEANYLPFKNNSFDVVTMIYILHHLPAPQKILQEVYRLSKTFILFEKNRLNPYEWLCLFRKKGSYPSDPSLFVWELKQLIKDSGFAIEKINYYQLVTYSIYNFRILKNLFWRDKFIKGILYISRFLQKVPGVRCFSHSVMVKGTNYKIS